jgi:hypothetical protein
MMRHRTVFDPTDGAIALCIGSPSEDALDRTMEAYAAMDHAWLPGWSDPKTQFVAGGAIVARPVIHLAEVVEIAVDTDWSPPLAPEGTRLVVDGEEVAVAGPGGFPELRFEVAAIYHLEMLPPFPWVAAAAHVTVTE